MRAVFLFLLASLHLFSDPKDPYVLAVTEGEPSSLVEGIVSAITGDLYISEADAIVQGCVPICLPRNYISGNGLGKYHGWFFYEHLHAKYTTFSNDHDHFITINDPNGTSFTYKGNGEEICKKYDKKKKHKKKQIEGSRFLPQDASQTPGLTNTAHGKISALTNLKNASIKLDADAKYFTLYYPDGTERCYERAHHQGHDSVFNYYNPRSENLDYVLQWEKLPTGTFIFYGYKNEELKVISTVSPDTKKTYASAHFYRHDNGEFEIETSDKKRLEYKFHHVHKHDPKVGFKLISVQSSAAPSESINYHKEQEDGSLHLSRRATVANRHFDVDYYRPKRNLVGNAYVELAKYDDPRCMRVKTLSSPVGVDANSLITHRFFYYPQNRYTDVREIDDILTRYRYSPEMRLESIERFGKNDTLVHKEQFVWGKDGSLLCRSFLDLENKPLFSRHFVYDDRGNVLEEKFQGNLSGQSTDDESYSTKREYSQDGRNLLLKEKEPNGKETLYTYLSNANLLSSKLITDHGQIKIRHFYEYNQDLIVIREISDDGSSTNPDNLADVKTRLIKTITPLTSGFVNMPWIIEEKYWDGHEERLLKKTILTYSPQGLVTQKEIYDSRGVFSYRLCTEYDAHGHPTKEIDALGRSAEYIYDAIGNKIYAKDPSGKRFTQMKYDYVNRLIHSEEIGLDGTEHITQHRYDYKHNKIATVDPFGNETRFVYDPFGHVIETHLPSSDILSSTYDPAGREISRTDAKGEKTNIQYNSRNQVTRIQHPDGTEEQFFYNLDGSLKSHLDQASVETAYTYDFLGRTISKTIRFEDSLLSQESFTYSAFNLLTKTDAEGNITHYEYDGAGRKIAEELNGERIEYFYDPLNRFSCTKRGDLLSFVEYDLLDRIVEERQENASGHLLTKLQYEYDPAGNKACITRFIDGKESKEAFLYDSFSRPIQQSDALGHITHISYHETKVLQTIHTDPLGLQTVETYDILGRLALVEKKNSHSETLSIEEFTYDPNGNLIRQISTVFLPDHSHHNITTEWEYGTMNRLLALVETGKVTRYTHTIKGLIHRIIKPDGVILENSYDPLSRLIELTSSDGSIHYTYQYDRLGKQIAAYDHVLQATSERHYDPHGRLLTEKLAHGHALCNIYNQNGHRTSLTLPDDSLIEYAYDSLFLRSVKWKDYIHTYDSYDLSGSLLQETLPSNLGPATYSTDPVGRCSKATSPFHSHHILEYDPAGNIKRAKLQNKEQTFSYDDLYQLAQESGHHPHSYTHDSNCNRLTKDNETYRLNALNQVVSHFEYDANGNPTRKNETLFRYDALDRLIEVEKPASKVIFTYDSFHRRMSKTTFSLQNNEWIETSHLFFLYDDQHEIGAFDKNGNLIQLRILGKTDHAERGSAVLLVLGGHAFVPLHDLFGNVIALVTPKGVIAETYHYSAFGEEAILDHHGISITRSGNPWRYASKRTEEETGLVYFGRRYYDPEVGRWLTPDPAGFTDTANLYAYVGNNPLAKMDLFGLMAEDRMILRPDGHFDFIKFDPIQRLDAQNLPSRPYETFSFSNDRSFDDYPRISYVAFEKHNPARDPSMHLDLGLKKENKNFMISYTNGMNTNLPHAIKDTKLVSAYSGGYNVHLVYNATHGLCLDLIECYAGLKQFIGTEPTALLKESWENYLQENPQGRILQVCTSQGAIEVRNGLIDSPKHIRNRISVLAVAPAAFIDQKLCHNAMHLISSRDFVPWFDKVGKRASRDGTVTYLTPHRNAALLDHSFSSPTYESKTTSYIENFIKEFGGK